MRITALTTLFFYFIFFAKELYASHNHDCPLDNHFYLQKNYAFNWQTITKKPNKSKISKEFLDNSIAFGYSYNLNLNSSIRSELEFQYSKVKIYSSAINNNEEKLSKMNMGRLLFNIYYDSNIYDFFGLKAYFGAGIGIIQDIKRLILDFMTEANTREKQNNINLTFQTMLGINYQLTSSLEIYGGYRYIFDSHTLYNKKTYENSLLNLLYTQFTSYNNNNLPIISYGGISLGIKYNF